MRRQLRATVISLCAMSLALLIVTSCGGDTGDEAGGQEEGLRGEVVID